LALGQGLGVADSVSVVSATHIDAFYFKDVKDGPDDAQEAAHHDDDYLHGVTHSGAASRTGLQVFDHSFVDLKHMGI
jgi:hypothetical protein